MFIDSVLLLCCNVAVRYQLNTSLQVLANTMGDLRIKGSGVFFDIDKFRGPDGMTREYFGPYAWRFEKTETDKTAGPQR